MTTAPDHEALAALAQALQARPRDAEALASAAARIAAGEGKALFEALLQARRGDDVEEEEVVVATMTALEAMMDARPGVAGYLMGRLYPEAARRRLHATADAIGLWMHERPSDELSDALTRLAREDVRPKLRKQYEAWAAKRRPPG